MPARSALPVLALLASLNLAACATTPRVDVRAMRPPRLKVTPETKIAHRMPTHFEWSGSKDLARDLFRWFRGEWPKALEFHGYSAVKELEEADLVVVTAPARWQLWVERLQGHATLVAEIAVFHADDWRRDAEKARPLYTATYEATDEAAIQDREGLMQRTVRRTARQFVNDLRPTKEVTAVPLDPSDAAVAEGIDLLRRREVNAASRAFAAAIERVPSSAPAHYNLAVLAERSGELDRAESLLMRAIELDPKPLYGEALDRVRRTREVKVPADEVSGDQASR